MLAWPVLYYSIAIQVSSFAIQVLSCIVMNKICLNQVLTLKVLVATIDALGHF